MDIEEHADSGGTQKAHVHAVEPDGVVTTSQLLRDSMFQLDARFRIDPPLHGQFDDRIAGRIRGVLTSLDADIHAGDHSMMQSGSPSRKYSPAKSNEPL